MARRGLLIILSSPSGAGKSTLARALRKWDDTLRFSVSATTREPRPGEVDGQDYFFVTEDAFKRQVSDKDMLEHARVFGNYYGSPQGPVASAIEDGRDVLFDIDWQGARKVRELMPEAISISVLPPSVDELERRLRSRGSDAESVIQSRMRQALDEMAHCREADFIVLNDDFNQALDDLSLILNGESDKLRALNVDVYLLLATNVEKTLAN